jgi:hypothetical protein
MATTELIDSGDWVAKRRGGQEFPFDEDSCFIFTERQLTVLENAATDRYVPGKAVSVF